MPIEAAGQPLSPLPGAYVNVIPPANNYLSPEQTDVLGVVGSATWGPVNLPTKIGGPAQYASQFGAVAVRQYDMGTQVSTAALQGAQNFVCVRVTDTTDTAATGLLGLRGTPTLGSGGSGNAVNDVLTLSNGATIKVNTVSGGAVATFTQLTQPTAATSGSITVTSTTGSGTGATFTYVYTEGATATSLYTGSGANTDVVTIAAGRAAGSWSATIYHPGLPTEVFQNIGAGTTGLAAWTAIVAAVNTGIAGRPASQIVTLTVGTSTSSPLTAATSITLAGGTDGASGVTPAMLIGVDVSPRTGMYALRKQFCSVGLLADCSLSTTWGTQEAFGLSEGVYMVVCGPKGDTISNAVTTKANVGLDTYAVKYLHGDWCYFYDSVNQLNRLASPQGFVAGWIVANGPQNSTLNKPLTGINGTQSSETGTVYYDDDLATLEGAGIDIVMTPQPGGNYFGCRFGCNASSNVLINGDNYTRMTNFIAATVSVGMGPYIGQLQLPPQRRNLKAALDTFFSNMWANGAIGTPNPKIIPWSVTCDSTNNPPLQVAQGIEQVDILVTYASVIVKLIANVQGGQSVQISVVNTTSSPTS